MGKARGVFLNDRRLSATSPPSSTNGTLLIFPREGGPEKELTAAESPKHHCHWLLRDNWVIWSTFLWGWCLPEVPYYTVHCLPGKTQMSSFQQVCIGNFLWWGRWRPCFHYCPGRLGCLQRTLLPAGSR